MKSAAFLIEVLSLIKQLAEARHAAENALVAERAAQLLAEVNAEVAALATVDPTAGK